LSWFVLLATLVYAQTLVTIDEWKKQEIVLESKIRNLLDKGFVTIQEGAGSVLELNQPEA